MNDDSFFSKKNQRKVSPFIGQELLYDYMTGHLDAERKKAVEDFLDQNREVLSEIQKIQHGMNYVATLSQTKVSEALAERIRIPTSYVQSVLMKIRFDEWPPLVRLALEASVVAVGISVLVIIVPWRTVLDFKIGSQSVVLSEVDSRLAQNKNVEAEVSKEEVAFPDEGAAEVATSTTVMPNLTVVAEAVKTAATKETPTTKPAPTTTLPPKSKSVVAATAGAPEEEKKTNGFLFRGQISVSNAKDVVPKIAEKISELGARKAGEVELGWSKGKGAYFHFTIPESRYEEVLTVFKEYGQIKISKEKHERVMPEGIVRVIINVDEKN